jgi:hypothetical protein
MINAAKYDLDLLLMLDLIYEAALNLILFNKFLLQLISLSKMIINSCKNIWKSNKLFAKIKRIERD